VDPRTFLPPRELALAAVPAPGDPAPTIPVTPTGARPTVLAFLRHTGCPFAEQTLRMLRDAAGASSDVRWVAVSHASAEATGRWSRALGGADGVELVSDPSRRGYAAWGLGRTTAGHFLGRRSLAAVAALAREGIRNRHPSGTRWQSAGTFALDSEWIVRWRHLPEHAGDVPDLAGALEAVAPLRGAG
jgi:hypothetical protein